LLTKQTTRLGAVAQTMDGRIVLSVSENQIET